MFDMKRKEHKNDVILSQGTKYLHVRCSEVVYRTTVHPMRILSKMPMDMICILIETHII